jgi:hypothetical protein
MSFPGTAREGISGGGMPLSPYTFMLIIDTPAHETFLGIAI